MRRNSNERLYQRGRVWWTWVYNHKGQRHDFSTKCRDRSAAVERAKQIEKDALNPAAAAQNQATVADACNLYRENKRKLVAREKRSVESLEFFETKIGNVQRLLESKSPLLLVDLTPQHLDEFVEARELEPGASEGSKVSAHTIKKELTAFRQALELAQRARIFTGLIEPLFPTDHTAEYQPRDRALDREEVSKLVRAFLPDPSNIYRKSLLDGDRAARVAFIIATASRWSGSERCMLADVAPDLSWVRLRETKTEHAERRVPIVTPEQKALLAFAMANAAGTKGRLFRPWDSVNRDFKTACSRAGIKRCSPNDLRRTMAIWLRAAGVPAEVVGMVLGHTTARMVETVYARLQRRPEDMRRLLQKHLTLDQNCSAFAAIPLHSAALSGISALEVLGQVLNIGANARNL